VTPAGNHDSAEESQPDFDQLPASSRELLAHCEETLAEFRPQPGVMKDLPQLSVESSQVAGLCRAAKTDPRLDFTLLLCLTCVDYEEYFQVVYFLLSMSQEQTLVVKTDVPYDDPRLPSVCSVWEAADWYEREVHDLFGVVFEGHPGLEPLLLYDEFEGFPGRKAFPLYDYQEF
jgi:NADH-quinone oxidoreductase subunit C